MKAGWHIYYWIIYEAENWNMCCVPCFIIWVVLIERLFFYFFSSYYIGYFYDNALIIKKKKKNKSFQLTIFGEWRVSPWSNFTSKKIDWGIDDFHNFSWMRPIFFFFHKFPLVHWPNLEEIRLEVDL